MKRIVTQSELTTFKLCRFKHYLRYEKGLTAPGKSISALAGSAGHKGLEVFYLTGDANEARLAVYGHFNEYRDEYAGNNWFTPELHEKWKTTRETILTVIAHYTDFYRKDLMKPALDPVTGESLVEKEFRIPVITNGGKASRFYDLAGKIDLVADIDGDLWIVDHKFKLEMGASLQDFLRISFQMRLYVYAWSVYLGVRVKGACFNVIRRQAPGTPKINKNGTVSLSRVNTTIAKYMDVLHAQDTILKEQGKSGLNFSNYRAEIERISNIKWFERYFYEYTDEDLMEIQREIYMTLQDIRRCKKNGAWAYFKNDLACNVYGVCQYAKMCRGVAADDSFVYNDNLHSELNGLEVHKRVGKGFIVSKDVQANELMTFEDAFDAVL